MMTPDGTMDNIIIALIGIGISMIAGFLLTMMFYKDKEETAETAEMPAEGDVVSDSAVQPHVPEIGNTSSALTFHELIIDFPQDAAEEIKADSEEPVKSEKTNEKISSSMIRDIFEQK